MLIALSLPIPYFLGLGMILAIAVPGLLDEGMRLPRREKPAVPALFLAAGILINYLLVLVVGDLRVASVMGAVLALAGAGYAVLKLRGRVLNFFAFGWGAAVVIAYLALLYGIPIFLDPLSAGDARSIWFFHGKMIYYSGGLTAATGLDTAAAAFSHVDYPKLPGVVAAQLAMVAGYWNEFLPKGSLAVLLLPPLLGVVSFFRGLRISALYLISLLFFGAGWYLWNGYMDGYLALYAAVSLLFWGRWLESGSAPDLTGGLLMLGVVMNLKNEGILFALALAATLAVTLLLKSERVPLGEAKRSAAALFLPLLCVVVWSVKKSAWGLENDLRLGPGSLPLVVRHLGEGAAGMIARSLLLDSLVAKGAILAFAALAAARLFRVRVPVGAWLAVGTGVVYFAGMFCIYLATTADLQWHLSTSAGRTMMTVLAGLFAGTFLVLRDMEELESEPVKAETRIKHHEHENEGLGLGCMNSESRIKRNDR